MKQLGTEEGYAVAEMFAVPQESCFFISDLQFCCLFYLHVQAFLQLFAFYDEI